VVEPVARVVLRPRVDVVPPRVAHRVEADLDAPVVEHLGALVWRRVHCRPDEEDAVRCCAEGDVVVAAVEHDRGGLGRRDGGADRLDGEVVVWVRAPLERVSPRCRIV